MSPSFDVANCPLPTVTSSPRSAFTTLKILSGVPSSAETLIETGLLKFASPSTVILSLNVTGVSNVVTRPPRSSPLSSSDSSREALSRNVSSPVIALIFLLPI